MLTTGNDYNVIGFMNLADKMLIVGQIYVQPL